MCRSTSGAKGGEKKATKATDWRERLEWKDEWTGDEPELTTWVFEPGGFAPLGKVVRRGENSRAFSIVSDFLGTPREMVDAAGKIAWKAQLDVYGAAKVEAGKADDCPWRWPGQYEDAETGLCYNRFRYYDKERGGYLSQDPIRLAGGMRLFGYVKGPICFADPLGLAECKVQGIHDDSATKGVHIDAPNGVELKVLPGVDGTVVFKPVFSDEAPDAVREAIRDAEDDLENDARFRKKLEDVARKLTKHLVENGYPAKSGETNFLAVALRKLGEAK